MAIGENTANGETALSHLTTLPTCPLNVKLPAGDPEQTVLVPAIEPATLGASIVTNVDAELEAAQAPL